MFCEGEGGEEGEGDATEVEKPEIYRSKGAMGWSIYKVPDEGEDEDEDADAGLVNDSSIPDSDGVTDETPPPVPVKI